MNENEYQRLVEKYLKNIIKDSKEFWEEVEFEFDDSKGDINND